VSLCKGHRPSGGPGQRSPDEQFSRPADWSRSLFSQYPFGWRQLSLLDGAVRDVLRVETFLGGGLGIAPERIRKLRISPSPGSTPPEPREMWPTYEAMVSALKRLAEEILPGDEVYIHYSGHGGRTSRRLQRSGRCPQSDRHLGRSGLPLAGVAVSRPDESAIEQTGRQGAAQPALRGSLIERAAEAPLEPLGVRERRVGDGAARGAGAALRRSRPTCCTVTTYCRKGPRYEYS
jgi:hypothetical protein